MKKNLSWLLLLPLAGMILLSCTKADDLQKKDTEKPLVTTSPTPRNVVLEEFTGIKCGYCPVGHTIAKGIYDANPGRVVIINVHAGSFSVPSGGQPDFRTQYGENLASFAGVTGYPQGMVNRVPRTGSGPLAMSRDFWSASSTAILNSGNSPVNVGMSSKWTASSRTLNIRVELYFTSALGGAAKLNVVLLQSGVVGYQASGGDSYIHNHILREMITGQWGEEITQTAQGSKVVKEYSYVLPADFIGIGCEVENCDVAAFVTSADNKTVHTGIKVIAEDGNTYISK